jgi:hypothetical protein
MFYFANAQNVMIREEEQPAPSRAARNQNVTQEKSCASKSHESVVTGKDRQHIGPVPSRELMRGAGLAAKRTPHVDRTHRA